MNTDVRRLLRWLQRAQPPRAALARALASGLVATATNVALLVAAVALLVDSANRPGLRAVAGVLIVIELLAFLRSPIRYNERLSAHRLGFAAVTRWRRWLVATIGRWDYSTWRGHAAGDLLDRSLSDTDELQDLWLRCVIPASTTIATMFLGDLIIGVLPPRGHWWFFALTLFVLQSSGILGLLANVAPLIRADRDLRVVRGAYVAMLVELSAATPELALLHRTDFADQRNLHVTTVLAREERRLARQRRISAGVAVEVTLIALAVIAFFHPATSPTWDVVVVMLTLSTFESLGIVRAALDTAVAISAAAERLEALEQPVKEQHRSWPPETTLRVESLTITEDDRTLLRDVNLIVAAGQRVAIAGPSGSGKSTLLRVLGALDHAQGSVTIGDVALDTIDEVELRRRVLYVPAEPGLLRGFALDVIGLGRNSVRDSPSDLAALGIDTDESTRWEELSRGERERIAIARALVTNPTLVLLDEPTSGLGVRETADVLSLLASTGASVLVVTHDPAVIAWCDVVYDVVESSLRRR